MKKNEKCLLIAEVGNCHEGSLAAAIEMLERAKESGADMVKFQAGTAEGFARNPTDQAQIQKYRKYELGRGGYDCLIKRGRELDIPVLFSVWSDEFSDYMALPWRKIAARQVNFAVMLKNDIPGTYYSIAHTLPIRIVGTLGKSLKHAVPLHCVSDYPAPSGMITRMSDVRGSLRKDIGGVGYSDHTIGIYWAVRMATDLYVRAPVIEKHFTLKHDFGPLRDHALAATPSEFKEMAEKIKG